MAWNRRELMKGVMKLCPENTPFTEAVVVLEGGSARFTGDGQDPTPTLGIPLYATVWYRFNDPKDIHAVKLIRMNENDETWMNVWLKP